MTTRAPLGACRYPRERPRGAVACLDEFPRLVTQVAQAALLPFQQGFFASDSSLTIGTEAEQVALQVNCSLPSALRNSGGSRPQWGGLILGTPRPKMGGTAFGLPCLAEAIAQRQIPQRRGARRQGQGQLRCQRPHLWRTPGVSARLSSSARWDWLNPVSIKPAAAHKHSLRKLRSGVRAITLPQTLLGGAWTLVLRLRKEGRGGARPGGSSGRAARGRLRD
jgi:hypothetical protein